MGGDAQVTKMKKLLEENKFIKKIFFIDFKVDSQSSQACKNNPCKNGGRCVDQGNTFYGYNCVCAGQWTGVNCDQRNNIFFLTV